MQQQRRHQRDVRSLTSPTREVYKIEVFSAVCVPAVRATNRPSGDEWMKCFVQKIKSKLNMVLHVKFMANNLA